MTLPVNSREYVSDARQSTLWLSFSSLPLYICPLCYFGQGEKIGQDQFGKFVKFSRLRFCEFVVGRVIAFEPNVVCPVGQILRERTVLGELLYSLRKIFFGFWELVFQSHLQRFSEHHSGRVKTSPKTVYALPETAFDTFGQVIWNSRFRFGVNLDNFVVCCRNAHPFLACRTSIKMGAIGMCEDSICPDYTMSSGERVGAAQCEGRAFYSAVRTIHFDYRRDHCLHHSFTVEKGDIGPRILRAQPHRAGRAG